MKTWKWQFKIGVILVMSSVVLYGIHYATFKDLHHILVFGFEHIAFIPLEVLLVTLVIEGFIEKREKTRLLEKLNMLVGLFYTRMGLKILNALVCYDQNIHQIADHMLITDGWTEKDFKEASNRINNYVPALTMVPEAVIKLKKYLDKHIDFLTGLLQNQNLMEHETFTELLSALFHLQDELSYREDLTNLKDYESVHLKVDLERVYKLLTIEWFDYMKYIKEEYPYMFVAALIHSPYDPRDRHEIEQEILKKRKML